VLRFVADENFDGRVIDGLLRRNTVFDVIRVQDAGLRTADDETILNWAAQEGRLLLTHDASTMTDFAYQRTIRGLPMPGVVEIPTDPPIGQVIDDLLILAECSSDDE
jgi:predicted nuclease of predicted toxin-antitoxin system